MISEEISYKIKGYIINSFSHIPFFRLLICRLREVKKSIFTNPDVSSHSEAVFKLLKENNIPTFPMFGTLLSIHRDGEFKYADDFDFALLPNEKFNVGIINRMSTSGAKLLAFSVVGEELVELSFDYKGARIDIFKLKYQSDYVEHSCPNFRRERPRIIFSQGLKKREYNSCFSVKYTAFDFVYNKHWSIKIPDDCVGIFERHYGKDWNIPKKSNFITYDAYEFDNIVSYNLEGEQDLLLDLVSEYLDKDV